MFSTILKKSLLVLVMVILAAVPANGVLAASGLDPSGPPAQRETSDERLERVWARQLRIHDRLGWVFNRAEGVIDKAQELIDRAAGNGKDVSAVQAALDAFSAALERATPIYESTTELVNSHAGFDDNGNVTDAEQAKETVKQMRDLLREIKQAMDGTGRALREAIREFREANP